MSRAACLGRMWGPEGGLADYGFCREGLLGRADGEAGSGFAAERIR